MFNEQVQFFRPPSIAAEYGATDGDTGLVQAVVFEVRFCDLTQDDTLERYDSIMHNVVHIDWHTIKYCLKGQMKTKACTSANTKRNAFTFHPGNALCLHMITSDQGLDCAFWIAIVHSTYQRAPASPLP